MPVAGRCQSCGGVAPTKYVEFRQNVGMLVMRQSKTVAGNFCKPCINKHFWPMTLTTIAVGWIGYISMVMAPIFVVNNVIRYVGTLGMPGPGGQPKRPSSTAGGGQRQMPYAAPVAYAPPQMSDAPLSFDDEPPVAVIPMDEASDDGVELIEEPTATPSELLKPQWAVIVARLKAKESLGVVSNDLAGQTGLSPDVVSAWVVDRVKRAKAKAVAARPAAV